MSLVVWNVILGVVWVLLTNALTAENFALGLLLGYLVLLLSHRTLAPSTYYSKLPQFVRFVGFFLWQLLLANLKLAHDVVTPTDYMRPAVLAIPLDARTDEEISLLANLVTLTPGTLSLDVSADRKQMYIHAMYVENAEETRREIKEGFERRVLELLR
jgi:multicomponent Na+:H+ antiporter subunit E